jgi:hypothetical protein
MRPASGLMALTLHLAIVSSISFGGFPTVLPDVRAFVVTIHGPTSTVPQKKRGGCNRLRH